MKQLLEQLSVAPAFDLSGFAATPPSAAAPRGIPGASPLLPDS